MEENVVVRVGNDYISEISPNQLIVCRKQSEKLVFPSEEVAKLFVPVIKFLSGSEETEITIISEKEDKENNSILGTFENAIKKANTLKLSRAKEILERNLVLGINKSFAPNKITYTAKIRSQSCQYSHYTVSIECNKKKEILKATCTCPDMEKEDTLNCKHILATILYIQEND